MQKLLNLNISPSIFAVGFFIFSIILILSVTKVTANESEQRLKVTFLEPIPLSELAEFMNENKALVPKELNYIQGDIQGGYTVKNSENINEAIINFTERHNEFLDISLERRAEEIQESNDKDFKHRTGKLITQLQEARKITEEEGLKVSSMEVIGKREILDNVKNIVSVENMDSISQKLVFNLNKGKEIVKNNLQNTAFASLCCETWAPYGGTNAVNQSYTDQTFYFNNTNAFGSSNTYEHETQVYNVNYADYNNYWSSNMPNAYYDTPFMDDIDNFTVGTYTGSSLSTYTQYYTYMSLKAGSASSSVVRIKGQLG